MSQAGSRRSPAGAGGCVRGWTLSDAVGANNPILARQQVSPGSARFFLYFRPTAVPADIFSAPQWHCPTWQTVSKKKTLVLPCRRVIAFVDSIIMSSSPTPSPTSYAGTYVPGCRSAWLSSAILFCGLVGTGPGCRWLMNSMQAPRSSPVGLVHAAMETATRCPCGAAGAPLSRV